MKTHLLDSNSKMNLENLKCSLDIFILNSDYSISKQLTIISKGFNLVHEIHQLVLKEYNIDLDKYYILKSKKLAKSNLKSKNAHIIFIDQFIKINDSSKLVFYPSSINVKLIVNTETVNTTNSAIEFSSLELKLDANILLKKVLETISTQISFKSKQNKKLCFKNEGGIIDDEYSPHALLFKDNIALELTCSPPNPTPPK